MSKKLFSKLSPSFPEGANPLPSHNYEGNTLKLVIQEAMKQEPAVATFHNNYPCVTPSTFAIIEFDLD